MQYAAKETSSFTLKPEPEDWRKAKRLGRYLKDNARVVLEYNIQKMPENVIVWSAQAVRERGAEQDR